MNRTITRRQLLRSAGVGAVGLGLSGVLGEIVASALTPANSWPP
jgi:hypothetical protein